MRAICSRRIGVYGILILMTGMLVLPGFLLLPQFPGVARAAQLTNISDTLSDSDVNVAADHIVQFTTATFIPDDDSTIRITFPAEFDLSAGFTEDDFDIDDDGTPMTTAGNCFGGDEAFPTVSGQQIIIQLCSGNGGSIATGSVVTVRVGTNAVDFGSGTNQIVNPTSTGSYTVSISGTGNMDDTGETRVAILDDVVTTAAVDTSLSFLLAGVTTSTDINGATTTISTVDSSTTLPFGVLPLNTPVTLGQELTVQTNANNGFVVTVQQDNNLSSASGGDIDLFADGNATSNPSAWTSPSADVSDENTWGHFGLTSEDDLNGNEFGTSSQLFVGDFASSTPRQIFAHDGPADASTTNIGRTQVAYRIEITSLQEAGDDYTNTLTYICTPTF